MRGAVGVSDGRQAGGRLSSPAERQSRRQAIGFGPRAPRYRAIRAFGRNTRAPAPP